MYILYMYFLVYVLYNCMVGFIQVKTFEYQQIQTDKETVSKQLRGARLLADTLQKKVRLSWATEPSELSVMSLSPTSLAS